MKKKLLILIIYSFILLQSNQVLSSESSLYVKKIIKSEKNDTAYQKYLTNFVDPKIVQSFIKENLKISDLTTFVTGFLPKPIAYSEWIQNGEKLINATKDGDIKKVEELLIKGELDIDTTDDQGFTALMIASYNGHEDIVKILLENNAKMNTSSYNCHAFLLGYTPLMLAIDQKKENIVNLLLNYKADVNLVNFYGNTALIIAVQFGYYTIVESLLLNRAMVNIINDQFKTAFDYAKQNKAILELLKKYSVKIHNNDSCTIL